MVGRSGAWAELLRRRLLVCPGRGRCAWWASWGRWSCPAWAADLGAGAGPGVSSCGPVRLSSRGGADPGDVPGLRRLISAAELGGSAPGPVPWSLGGDPGRQGCGRLRGRIFQGRGALYSPAKFSRIYSPAHFPGHSLQIRFSERHFCIFKIFPGAGKLHCTIFLNLTIFPSFLLKNCENDKNNIECYNKLDINLLVTCR